MHKIPLKCSKVWGYNLTKHEKVWGVEIPLPGTAQWKLGLSLEIFNTRLFMFILERFCSLSSHLIVQIYFCTKLTSRRTHLKCLMTIWSFMLLKTWKINSAYQSCFRLLPNDIQTLLGSHLSVGMCCQDSSCCLTATSHKANSLHYCLFHSRNSSIY